MGFKGTGDGTFDSKSMVADAKDFGDPQASNGKPAWDPRFLQQIDGLIFMTGDTEDRVRETFARVKNQFAKTVREVASLGGQVRGLPGNPNRGHEQYVTPPTPSPRPAII
jgi:hypothetical protein